MKKLLSLVLVSLLCMGLIAGCAPSENMTSTLPEGTKTAPTNADVTEEPKLPDITVNAAVMTGPTAIGTVKLMDDAESGSSALKYNFTVAGTADEINPKLIQGKLDIAAVPVNLASNLYNKTNGGIKILAVNTLGVLYITAKGEAVSSVLDLKGKTILATGKGQTPEYTLRHILKENGIDPDKDVNIEFKSEPKEIVAIMKQSENAVAMLPQPYVTVAQGAVEGLTVALDLTAEWDKLPGASKLVTGSVVVRTEFAEQYPEVVEAFMKEYELSTKYANENIDGTAALLEKFGIFNADVAKKAIPYCNIVFMAGDEMKSTVGDYLAMLYSANPASVGGKLPEDSFYYAAK